jgi:predicted amidohydrolase
MATSGYSFFSRAEIAEVSEPIPGITTQALGAVAEQHGVYVVVGMPEFDPDLNAYFNSAVLIGPDGNVAGVYRKRNNLLEASYNAEVFGAIPTFDTPYGRIGIVICADLFYPHFPRAAAVAGAQILLAPANVGITTDFMRVRSFENGIAIVVANRYGQELQGVEVDHFNQETFAIRLPFAYNFDLDSRSVIMDSGGRVLVEIDEDATKIGYADLPVGEEQAFPVIRKPSMYALIAQDTLEPYTRTQLGLPDEAVFTAAAIDPGSNDRPWEAAIEAIEAALDVARTDERQLRLAVFPETYFNSLHPDHIAVLKGFAMRHNVDVLISAPEDGVPISLLIASTGETYTYRRTHRRRNSTIPASALSDNYWVVDRDYGRVAITQGVDMLAPETSLVLAKLGVDVIAVSADDNASVLDSLWATRSADYVHLVVANKRGREGVYLGGYRAVPSQVTDEGTVLLEINTAHVRKKKVPRFFDYTVLLLRCDLSNC